MYSLLSGYDLWGWKHSAPELRLPTRPSHASQEREDTNQKYAVRLQAGVHTIWEPVSIPGLAKKA